MRHVRTSRATGDARGTAPGVGARASAATTVQGGSLWRWLDAPLSTRWCTGWWVVATALFVGLVTLSGGPGRVDAAESVYSTWSLSHGQLACAFPSVTLSHEPLVAPLYPLASGALVAVTGIGHAVPFPTRGAMGAHCGTADVVIRQWAARTGALVPTSKFALTGWLALMAGVVAWLRATGRGRRRWEPATLVALACLPPIFVCISVYFHPQDLFAMGFVLAALACGQRERWAWAGVFVALAVLSQQFALLVAAPLLPLAPGRRRWHYLAGATATTAVLVLPLIPLTAGGVLRAVTLGSGNNPSIGGTALWHLHLAGPALIVVSRVLPIALATACAWWAVRRLGPEARAPGVMLALVVVALGLRLVFEQNLLPYYFMALVVAVVLLDVTAGRVRGSVLAWVGALTLVFCINGYFLDVTVGLGAEHVVPPVVLLVALGMVLRAAVSPRRGARWEALLWSAVGACVAVTWTSVANPLFVPLPVWAWQAVFVTSGMLLALSPLRQRVRQCGDWRTGAVAAAREGAGFAGVSDPRPGVPDSSGQDALIGT